MNNLQVVVVGAGPTGLMLAAELAGWGVRCVLLEKRSQAPNITRAFAVHARTLEVLDSRGLADEAVARGRAMTTLQPLPGVIVDVTGMPSRFPMVLMVPQSGSEAVLEKRVHDLGVEVVRDAEVVGLSQDSGGVELTLADGRAVHADYVVGTDGAHSAVRDLLGVEFVGERYATTMMLADLRVTPPPGADWMFGAAGPEGIAIVIPFDDGYSRLIAWDLRNRDVPVEQPLAVEDLRESFRRIAGYELEMQDPRWISRFHSERRQAAQYRVGRVLLAGDAAHANSPIGGQGLNTGVQDAANLGWKLAATVQGWGPIDLLDSYHAERHPVAEAMLEMTDQLTKLTFSKSRLRHWLQPRVMGVLVRIPPVRAALLRRVSGLGIAYPATEPGAHRLVGTRVADRRTDAGRLAEVQRAGRFVVLDATGDAAPSPWPDRVVTCRVEHLRGEPLALLLRPDGHVAWAADSAGEVATQLPAALARWVGPR